MENITLWAAAFIGMGCWHSARISPPSSSLQAAWLRYAGCPLTKKEAGELSPASFLISIIRASSCQRILIRHTDLGREMAQRIETLTALRDAYKKGLIVQKRTKDGILQ